MTDLKEFIWRINRTPSILTQVDWVEETDGFDENRMRDIIKGIKNDEVCNMVKDYIATSWYDACNGYPLNGVESCKLMSSTDKWKYVPVEENEYAEYELPTIEDIIDRYIEWRKKTLLRQAKKQVLDARTREIETSMTLAKNAQEGFDVFIADDLFANHYYNECKQLLEENKQLHERLEQCEKKTKRLISALVDSNVHKLVENIISYAEKFPSNQNEKAATIKEVLMSKMCNGVIQKAILDDKLMKRLTNLGRKEPSFQINTLKAETFYDIHNNEEVNL